jgi:hypothetical protein
MMLTIDIGVWQIKEAIRVMLTKSLSGSALTRLNSLRVLRLACSFSGTGAVIMGGLS